MSENNEQENASQAETTVYTMPESFKEKAALKDFKDIDALGEAYINLKQYQGSSIRIPGEDAGEDQIKEFNQKLADVNGVMLRPDFDNAEQSNEFFKTLGKPNDIDGYVFDPIEGFSPNEDKMKSFKELALETNLTKAQATRMAKRMMEQDAQAASSASEANAAQTTKLKAEWGHAFDQNVEVAVLVAKATKAPDSVVDALSDGTAGAEFTKWMYDVSRKFDGEGENMIHNEQRKLHATPDEIRDQISDIMNNQEHPYYVATHPDHKRALDKMLDLQRKLAH